jgi:hypothetical protein
MVFLPLLIVILLFRTFNKRLLQWETLMFIALAMSIAAFHYEQILTSGSSYGWLRFFVYPLPIAIAWLPYEFGRIEQKGKAFKNITAFVCCAALVVSGVLTGIVLNNPDIANEEYSTYKTGNADFVVQKEVADYINQNCNDGIILLDSYETYYIILNLDSTGNVITTCSYTFEDALNNLADSFVLYIVTVNPERLGASDAINIRYPDLYESGASWCTLVMEWDNHKLYKVIY